MPAELSTALSNRIDELLSATGAPAITAAIDAPVLGRWTSTLGLERVSPPVTATEDTWFYWASMGKVLTAALVLQAADEGLLSLEAPLS